MFYYLYCALSVILLAYVSLFNASPLFEDYDDPVTAQRFSQFNCFKKKSCTPGPPKICGYDVKTMEVAEFEDSCTYYRINCEGGFFKKVDMLACESKKAFMNLQNTTMFPWHHLNKSLVSEVGRMMEETATTVENTVWQKVMPGIVQLVLNTLL